MLSLFEDHNQAVVWFYLYARDCFSVHTISSISKATGISVRTLPSVLNALAKIIGAVNNVYPKRKELLCTIMTCKTGGQELLSLVIGSQWRKEVFLEI